jgi:hypothetical protein
LFLQRLALQLWLWSVLLLLLPSLVHSCHITISSRLLPGGQEQWRPWQFGSLLVDVLLLGGCVQRRHLESSFFETMFGSLSSAKIFFLFETGTLQIYGILSI